MSKSRLDRHGMWSFAAVCEASVQMHVQYMQKPQCRCMCNAYRNANFSADAC